MAKTLVAIEFAADVTAECQLMKHRSRHPERGSRIVMVDPSLFTLPYDAALCEALSECGYEVTLYGRRPRALETAEQTVRIEWFFYRLTERIRRFLPVPVFRALKGGEHCLDMLRLVLQVARAAPLAVHFQWTPLPIVDRLAIRMMKRCGVPLVLTLHDTTPFNGSSASKWQTLAAKDIWREFDQVIVHSKGSKSILARQGFSDQHRISVIPMGLLDTRPVTDEAAAADHRTVILLFGRLKSYKGPDILIEALGMLPEDVRRACVVRIVGEPMMPIEPLRVLAANRGVTQNIEWDLRYVSAEEMSWQLAHADILCFPYRDIDTSAVLMSSFRYGKPVVASCIGAFAELLENGVNGLLVPPADPAALARALESLLRDPLLRSEIGRNVARLAEQVPTWGNIARKTLGVYLRTSHAGGESAASALAER